MNNFFFSRSKSTNKPAADRNISDKMTSNNPSLFWALTKALGHIYLISCGLRILSMVLQFVGPILLRYVTDNQANIFGAKYNKHIK